MGEAATPSLAMHDAAICVESEWATLRECVYGSPDTFVLPAFFDDSKLRAQGEFGHFWAKNQGVAVACVDALPKGLPGFMRDWDVVSVPKALAKAHVACNNLVLDDMTVVVAAEEALDPIAQALTARKFDVIRIPYRVTSMAGGSFRCAYQPLIRN